MNTEKLAELIKSNTYKDEDKICSTCFIEGLCDILQEDNPKFDREQFTEACS